MNNDMYFFVFCAEKLRNKSTEKIWDPAGIRTQLRPPEHYSDALTIKPLDSKLKGENCCYDNGYH